MHSRHTCWTLRNTAGGGRVGISDQDLDDVLLLRVVQPARTLGMPEGGAVLLLLGRNRCRRFAGGHGIATHRLLEPWCGEDEGQRDRSGADVLAADPGV